jgi:uncharacterized glyoxalase superfamily protein PhnB
VTPVLTYPDVAAAVEWLTSAFGFVEHVRIGDHRAQLGWGAGALVVADATNGRQPPAGGQGLTHTLLVRVEDVDAHCRRVQEFGGRVVSMPEDHPYGERQYSVEDLAGHRWTFTQTITDLPPEEWGGTTVQAW